jgi:hypothetical protein
MNPSLPPVLVDTSDLPVGASPAGHLQHQIDGRTGQSVWIFTPAQHWSEPERTFRDKRTLCTWLCERHYRLPRMINNQAEPWLEPIFVSTRKRPLVDAQPQHRQIPLL